MSGSIIYTYWGLNNPKHAININSNRYIVADYGNNRVIELNSTLTTILKNYSITSPVFLDYSEDNETLLITSETLNQIREVTWSDLGYGTLIWQSSYSFSSPQCATYKEDDVNLIVMADTNNNRVVKYDRINGTYNTLYYYKLDADDTSTIHEISSFYKPYRVYQYANGNICITEKEGREIDWGVVESSSSNSSSSSSSSSTEIRSSSSSSSSSSSISSASSFSSSSISSNSSSSVSSSSFSSSSSSIDSSSSSSSSSIDSSSSSSSYDRPFGSGFVTYPACNGVWILAGAFGGYPLYVASNGTTYLSWGGPFGDSTWLITSGLITKLYRRAPDSTNMNGTYNTYVGGVPEGTIT